MADTKVSALTENTAPLAGDLLYQVDDPGGTPTSKKMTIGALAVANAPVQGGIVNGYISRSVASSNLTVAIKTIAGSDPSATDPVFVRIGNSVREITTALSVTKNAGTNWCNAGGAELATNEADYFVYLGYNATDGVVIGFSRIPFARVYSDFSATTTNEKYCGISTITNATATDEYEVIGRFNATLSGGAGYTWSVPATSVVVSRPIFETRALTFTPTHTRVTTGYTNAPTTNKAQYRVSGSNCFIYENHTQDATPGGSGLQQFTIPFVSGLVDTGEAQPMACFNNDSAVSLIANVISNNSYIRMVKYDGTAEATASQRYIISGFFRLN